MHIEALKNKLPILRHTRAWYCGSLFYKRTMNGEKCGKEKRKARYFFPVSFQVFSPFNLYIRCMSKSPFAYDETCLFSNLD